MLKEALTFVEQMWQEQLCVDSSVVHTWSTCGISPSSQVPFHMTVKEQKGMNPVERVRGVSR